MTECLFVLAERSLGEREFTKEFGVVWPRPERK
jgi:hypothetical protein